MAYREFAGLVLSFALVSLCAPNLAAADDSDDPMLLYDHGGLSIRAHFQGGVNAVGEENLFWNFAETFAPNSGFDSDASWLEGYLKPGISFENKLGGSDTLYGKFSAVASYTLGTDAYDASNTGRITVEEAFLGYRSIFDRGRIFDVSVGPRELKLGTGMLVSNGGSSGFERGALKFGPRKAWEMAAIGRVSNQYFTGTAFYIDPNEMPSNDGKNSLAGVDARFDSEGGGYLGATYLNVFNSNSAYPQAAPGGAGAPMVIRGAREGLNAVNLYARTNPIPGGFGDFFVAADFAQEWNDAVNMRAWAGRVQAGVTFRDLTWTPSLMYSFQTFSGDDPLTARLERFDPLYYEGSPSAWSTGSKSSMVFINSNVQAHGLSLAIKPTPRDTVTFRYAHIRANELASPVQFGQATRVGFSNNVPSLVSGVTHPHLADDFFLEYNRIINPNTFLTAGFSLGIPGKGIRDTVGGNAPNWIGGFVNVVVNY